MGSGNEREKHAKQLIVEFFFKLINLFFSFLLAVTGLIIAQPRKNSKYK